MTPLSPGKWWGLRRLADRSGRFKMLAVDQRPPIKNLVAERRGTSSAAYSDVCDVKRVLVETLGGHCSAVLLDPHYAYPAAIDAVDPARGVLLTLEDSVFVDTDRGRLSSTIDNWSVAKIKRAGGDAVKVLAWYRPDASPEVNRHQENLVAAIGRDCERYDIPFVFELLLYPLPGEEDHTTEYTEQAAKRPRQVIESVAKFADPEFGVDLFKLESPLPAADVPDPETADVASLATTQQWFDDLGNAAGRPWVMLSAGATKDAFRRVLTYAYRAGASGYLAGRAIWWDAFQDFPDLDSMEAKLRDEGVRYTKELNALTDELATPWTEHPAFGDGIRLPDASASFRHDYSDFGR